MRIAQMKMSGARGALSRAGFESATMPDDCKLSTRMSEFLRALNFIKKHWLALAALCLCFLFRLWFGLASEFWFDDEKQIYLLGLKFYTTRQWPFFGPVVDYHGMGAPLVQIPGALQGLLAGLPFFAWPQPEAPFILLNILSFSSLCFFAWYCTKRLPEVSRTIIWSWLLTAPWVLEYSTHVVNISYILPGAILFFVGVWETWPSLSKRLITPKWAFLMMGLALVWIMQLHMSWVILIPFLLASFYFQYKEQQRVPLTCTAWFALGALLLSALLIPTYIKYGFAQGLGGMGSTVQVNEGNLTKHLNVVEGILGWFLSFASFEMARFLGPHTVQRLAFVKRHLWLSPAILFLLVVGILQPVAMLVLWFKKNHTQPDWRAVKYFTLFLVLLLYTSFLFSAKTPQAHTIYLTLPVAMLYSLYCWSPYLKQKRWRIFAHVVIICGIIFHFVLSVDNLARKSLYINRGIPAAAIENKDYKILGEARPGAQY